MLSLRFVQMAMPGDAGGDQGPTWAGITDHHHWLRWKPAKGDRYVSLLACLHIVDLIEYSSCFVFFFNVLLISDTLKCPWYILLPCYFEQRLVRRNVRTHRIEHTFFTVRYLLKDSIAVMVYQVGTKKCLPRRCGLSEHRAPRSIQFRHTQSII